MRFELMDRHYRSGARLTSKSLITIPDEIAEFLGDSSVEIERHVHEVLVLDLSRRHVISGGHAAGLLGIEKFAFIRWAGENGIPYFRTTPEDWQHELESIGMP